MKDAVFVTGNADKAHYFNDMTGLDIDHRKADVDEIQSLKLREVIEHKARQAYEQIGEPVIVEDTRLSFIALGSLPGTFVKWFLDQLGVQGLCALLDSFDDRRAIAGAAVAYFDGSRLEIFEKSLSGTISKMPKGDTGFGWNPIFQPDGSDKTLGEMSDEEFREWYAKIKPFTEIADFIKQL